MSHQRSSLGVAEPGASYQSSSSQPQWVEVLVDCPGVQGLYTYRLPPDLTARSGNIVSVPFGAQIVGGIVISRIEVLPADLEPSRIREVEEVITAGFFPTSYWQLLDRVARYYCTDLMAVIRGALPPGLLGRSQLRIRLKEKVVLEATDISFPAQQILRLLKGQKTGDYSAQYLQRKVRGASKGIRELSKRRWIESYLEAPKNIRPKLQKAVTLVVENFPLDLPDRQREVLAILRSHGGELWLNQLLQICHHASASTVETLASKGCVVIEQREKLRLLRSETILQDRPKELTQAQQEALETIKNLQGFARVLLHGVTGSGKTEVYLQAIAPILEAGKSALVLVPEIGLTPQLTDRFRARFGNKVCVYHSALSDGERYDTWRQMLTGAPQVVIGTRSAIFAPLPNLGLIVLDEEHDTSFKQYSPPPTYHARDVAIWRGELENCPLILGSATPSLESWVRVRDRGAQFISRDALQCARTEERSRELGEEHSTHPNDENPSSERDRYLSLPERIQSRPLPPVEIVDMRRELQEGNRSIFSRSLQEALENLQEGGKQGILFVSRRGHSTFVSCRSCGYVMECPHCDVSLSYHYTHEGAAELLRCHYCNYTRLQPRHCPECGSPYFKFFGSGTQRVMQELGREFPHLRCIRFDSDTTRTKGAHRTLLTRFATGEADVLVGTQMLTKGLDIDRVTLVGVVAADGLLYHSDYRASERAFQTLTQVAGRSGRGDDPGRVIIQSYSPEHPVIQAVRQHDYQSFVEMELSQRQSLSYPPYGRLILMRLSGVDGAEVQQTAELMAEACVNLIGSAGEVLGPAPANIMRVARRYRWHILLKFSAKIVPNLETLKELRGLSPQSVSVTLDVDPLSID